MLYVDMSDGEKYLKYPYVNQATSEFLETQTKFGDEKLLMFFQPQTPIVICGVNQNIYAEVNLDYLRAHNIELTRRGAGGGAVYVDQGNLTYGYIDSDNGNNYQNFPLYAQTALEVLHELGVPAKMGGRNDLTVDGKKFSGMSSLKIGNRFSCGGTLMIDVDLENASRALHPLQAKLRSKGVKSVHSRVTNIRSYFKPKYQNITLPEIRDLFLKFAFKTDDLSQIPTYKFTDADWQNLVALGKSKYGDPKWVYGENNQEDEYFHAQHFADFGTVEISFSVDRGVISHCQIYGDFSLASGDLTVIERNLVGVPLQKANLIEALNQSDLKTNIGALSAEDLANVILDPTKQEEVHYI
ncbi:MAG: lipoate--protein ligase [Lactobacillus sp.]|nr:lipoate--protein ligase [Lactobacillus sp.]